MEADLGIDSIKRVEILSTLAKRIPGAPSVDPEKLSNLRTLGHVLAFTSPATVARAPEPAAAVEVVSPAEDDIKALALPLTRAVVVPMRIPAAGSKPAPVELPEDPILVMEDQSGLADAIVAHLIALGCRASVVKCDAASIADAAALPAGGLILLAPDGPEWTAASEATLKSALRLARAFGGALRSPGRRNAFVAATSRRDGAFGLASKSPSWNPLSGGLAGLVKTLGHEWPEVRCRAIDVASSWSVDEAARAIVQ
jgi:hypothetical protein